MNRKVNQIEVTKKKVSSTKISKKKPGTAVKSEGLMSLKNIGTNEYSKKRIELFNSRVNNNHKSYNNT